MIKLRIFKFIILISFLLLPTFVYGQAKYDLACPVGNTQPFSPLVTNNPQTGNLKANGCIDPTGLITWNGVTGVAGAATPLNSLQFNNSGNLGGSQFIYNPNDTSNTLCLSPCVDISVTGRNSGLIFTSISGNNFVTTSVQDDVFGAEVEVDTSVTNPGSESLPFASVGSIGGNTVGGSCFDTTGNLGSSPPCVVGYTSEPGDIVGDTFNGQDIIGFNFEPRLSKTAGHSVNTVVGFSTNNAVTQASGPFTRPIAETSVNTFGFQCQDLGGFSTTEQTCLKIIASTTPGSGTKFAINALANAGKIFSGDGLQAGNITGSTKCVHADTNGNLTGTTGDCSIAIANGTSAMGTSAITSGSCATVVTTSATNALTSDTYNVGFSSDPTAITGYGASATGAVLTIYPYLTANNINFKVCNNTSASITPSALTLTWSVHRP